MQDLTTTLERYPSACLLLKGSRVKYVNKLARETLGNAVTKGDDFIEVFHLQHSGLAEFLSKNYKQFQTEQKGQLFKSTFYLNDNIYEFSVALLSTEGEVGEFTVFISQVDKEELWSRKLLHRSLNRIDQFKAFFNQLAEGILLTDSNLKVHFTNDTCIRLLKIDKQNTESSILLENGQEVEKIRLIRHLIRQANRTKRSVCQEFNEGKIIYQFCIYPFRDDKLSEELYAVFITDVTLQLALDQDLVRSEEEFKSLTENSPDVFMKFDRDLRHLYVNKAVAGLIGMTPDQMIGKTHEELGFPGDMVRFVTGVLRDVFEKGTFRRLEYTLHNGKSVDWCLLPVYNDKGQIKYLYSISRELTALKQVESELRESQQHLEFALQMANMAYWEYNFTQQSFILSRETAALLGVPDHEFKPIIELHEFLNKYVEKEDHHELLSIHKKVMNEKQHQGSAEFRVKVQGEIRYLKGFFKTINASDKERRYNLGVVQDISEYKRKQEELIGFQTKLQKLVDSQTKALKISQERMSDSIKLASLGRWQLELGSDVVVCDEQVADMLGLSEQKTEGKFKITIPRMLTMLTKRDALAFRKMQKKALRTVASKFFEQLEIRVQLPGQDLKYFLITVRIKKEKEYPFKRVFYGNFQDITSIRYTESNERMFSNFVNSSDYWIGIVDADYRITYLNESARQFFNIGKKEEVSRFFALQQAGQPNLGLFTEDEIKAAEKKGSWEGESVLTAGDALKVPVSQVIIAHRGMAGEILCYSTIISDLSAIKSIQQELLKEKKELDTFIYHASHDLKGPVASLKGLNVLVGKEFEDPVSLKYFKLYNKGVNRIYNILMSLIKLSSIKDMKPKHNPVFFEPLVNTALQNMSYLTGFEKITFHKQIQLERPYYGDFNMLLMLLEQLLKNAITFRNNAKDSQATIRVFDEVNALWIEVSDNGQGMDTDIQDKVFNLFYKGDETAHGPGLGLYLVWNIVEKLQGEIMLESEKNVGTKFLIKLPHN